MWPFLQAAHKESLCFTDKQNQRRDGNIVVTSNDKGKNRRPLLWLVYFTYFTGFTYSLPPADQSQSPTASLPVLLATGRLFAAAITVKWSLWKCKWLTVSRGLSCFSECKKLCNIWGGRRDKTAACCVLLSTLRDVSSAYLREFWYPLLKTLQWLTWHTQLSGGFVFSKAFHSSDFHFGS